MSLQVLMRRLSPVHWIMASVVLVSLLAFASKRLKRKLVLRPYLVRRGEIHRLLTGAWIHGDAAHLITNMFVFWLFADRVLAAFGPILFVALYVSAAVVAYLPSVARHYKRPQYSSLGASGAVAAVMLSAVLLDPTMRMRLLFFPFPIPGVVFGLLYIAYSVWHSHGSDDNVNHDAHFSGAAYGVLATAVWAPAKVEHALRVVGRLIGL